MFMELLETPECIIIGIVVAILVFVVLYMTVERRMAIVRDKKLWNNGQCDTCNKEWVLKDIRAVILESRGGFESEFSHYERVYTCECADVPGLKREICISTDVV